MFGKNTIRAVAFCLVLLAACRQKPAEPVRSGPPLDPAAFDGARALREAGDLVALGPRDSATAGAEAAAKHLCERLQAAGVEASIDEFKAQSPLGETVFRNVMGRLPGGGKGRVLLASHYDTKSGIPGFEGANDSASSSGALIELARVMAKSPELPFEVVFVFFDGEECMEHYGVFDGLQGSRYLAKKMLKNGQAADVKAMILMDMIGDRDLTVTLPRNSTPALISMVFDAAREDGTRDKFMLSPLQIGDDHDPFFSAGIPAIDIIDFHFGSAPGRNDYWHTPADSMDKISAESLGTVGRVVLRMVNKLAAEP